MLNPPALVLLSALALISASYAWLWLTHERIRGNLRFAQVGALRMFVGFIANFFDTLGIGSFAPTTAAFKLRGLVTDELIPGTLNVGHTLPTAMQGLIFVAAVTIDPLTLISMIAAAVLGAWIGAGVVAAMRKRTIQLLMSFALFAAATLLILMNTGALPGGGTALSLSGSRLAIAIAANFGLGALMSAGVGLYAPCLILVSLLGMDPIAAFPIMMGSCAFLMPVSARRFIRSDRYDARAALGLLIGGVPAVLLAAFIVKSLPLDELRWLVVVIALYTAGSMGRAAAKRTGPR